MIKGGKVSFSELKKTEFERMYEFYAGAMYANRGNGFAGAARSMESILDEIAAHGKIPRRKQTAIKKAARQAVLTLTTIKIQRVLDGDL